MKVVAGHNGTYAIAGDDAFNGIYYDGASHYYIDGTVMMSKHVNVLMVDTETDRYYQVEEDGMTEIEPYTKRRS